MVRETLLALVAIPAIAAPRSAARPVKPPVPIPGPDANVVRPEPRLKTAHIDLPGIADDAAIWVHPTRPERSLMIGTDKMNGLMVYDLDGELQQVVSRESHPDNVDVLYDFKLGGKTVDLALAGCRPDGPQGIKVWRIDPATDSLTDATQGGVLPVFGGTEPYGSCVYHSRRTGKSYFFVTNKLGAVEQHLLVDAGNGKVKSTRVRSLKVPTTAEGCVADDELGIFYLSEERVGIWKFEAEPNVPTRGKIVARVGQNGLVADIEGLTLYCATGGRGYLIASSQGNSTYKVYDRRDGNRFLLTIQPRAGRIPAPKETDGIAVTSCPTSRDFPGGVLVAQNGLKRQPTGNNFLFFRWEEIAGKRLIVDTHWSPRAKTPQRGPGSVVAGDE